MNNNELNTFLLLMLFGMAAVFMGIWAFIGYLIIKGIRKTKRIFRRTAGQFNALSGLPLYSAAPLVQPAKYDRRHTPLPVPVAHVPAPNPVLRRVATIVYTTKEY